MALDTVKFMAPGSVGGGYDQTARVLGKALIEANVAKSATFENKGGAGGTLGLAQFANSTKGDPNALLVVGAIMVAGIEQNKPQITLKDVTPIARLFTEYNVIAVRKESRAVQGKVVSIDQASLGIGVSKRIRSIVAKAVAVKPDDRYQTVVELQSDVRGFLQGGLHLPRRSFAPGALIIREGELGQEAYMIISGTCRTQRARDGQQETLNTMTAGDVFGEMALLLAEPRAASVLAVDQVTVLVLDEATMTAGLGIDGWTGALVRALAHRFRALEQQMRDSGIRRS